MQSDVVQAIADLIRNEKVDPGGTSCTIPGVKMDNIYNIFEKYFNADAKKAFQTASYHQIHQRNEVVMTPGLGDLLRKLGLKSCQGIVGGLTRHHLDKVHFCASMADKQNLHKAVENVIKAVNDLATRGYVTAYLVKLNVLSFAPTTTPEPDFAVISYIALTDEGHTYVEQNMPKMFIDEGGVPERFDKQ